MLKYLVEKITSKKFIGFLVASYFFQIHLLSEQLWFYAFCVYVGLESGMNILEKFTKKEQ